MACGSILVQGLNIAALRFEDANKIAVVDRLVRDNYAKKVMYSNVWQLLKGTSMYA